MKPAVFEYCAPRSLERAIDALVETTGAMVLAGGQSLVPAMNMRLASPARLIDIQHVEGLKGIDIQAGQIIVKAMTRHRELELNDAVCNANPLIREAMAHVAHVPIRNRGTTVGSICHADAAAEMPMVLLATDGTVTAAGPSGVREIPAADFFQFHMTTTRQADEIIVDARFSSLPEGAGWAFEEFTRRHGDYAIAAVAAIVDRVGNRVSLAACGIGSRPVRLHAAEMLLVEGNYSEAAITAAAESVKDEVTAPDDMHATNAYRRDLLAALVRRAVRKAISRAR